MIAIRPGVNLVPDELLQHHYLRSFIDAGGVTLSDVDEPRRSIDRNRRAGNNGATLICNHSAQRAGLGEKRRAQDQGKKA